MRGLPDRILSAARARGAAVLLRMVGLPLAYLVVRVAELSNRGAGVALVYHRVGDPAGDPRRELVPALGTALFGAQVRHLAARYQLVGAGELLATAERRRRGTPFPVAITFDDDLASHADVAGAILASAGVRATFFVTGASLRGPHRFWWERLQVAADNYLDLAQLGLAAASAERIHQLGLAIQSLPPHARDELDARLAQLVGPDPVESGLRADALRRLAATGVEIGFHTRRHYELTGLEDHQLTEAMREGRREIEEIIGQPLRTISYPHGRADSRVAEAARTAGFEAGFSGVPEPVASDCDPLLLGRLSPSYRSVGELAFTVAWELLRAALSGRARATTAPPGRPATLL